LYAISQVLVGLLVAHVAWLFFFVTGLSVEPRNAAAPTSAGRAMLRIVIATAAGFAICGFEGFVLGMVGLLTVPGLAIMVAANLVTVSLVHRNSVLERSFWIARGNTIRIAFNAPALLLYAVMLVLCTQAALPDISSDGVRIHLAYPYEWFRAGRIYADYRFRFPYYAFNYELLYAWMFVARLGRYVAFLNWLAGTIVCLGIFALIASIDEAAQRAGTALRQGAANVVYIALPLSVVLSAVFLRWTGTAMEDTATGMFFLAAIGAAITAILTDEPRYVLAAILCTSFLAGMKPSFFVFVPAAVVLMLVGLKGRVPKRRLLGLIVLLCALSSPWYVRNLIQDGDPVPPVFNLMLRGKDPSFTKAEWAGITADLHTDHSAAAVASYPLRVLSDPLSKDFREYGVTAVFLSLYAIAAGWLFFILRSSRSREEWAIEGLLTWTLLGVAYLFASSTLARYSLLFYPAMAAAAGSLLLYFAPRIRFGLIVIPFFAVATIIPSASADTFYLNYDVANYMNLSAFMPSDNALLDRDLAGYSEAEGIFNAPALKLPAYNTVLLVQAEINYYVELHGAHAFGDWFGPGSYRLLAAAIDRDGAMEYMDANKIGAVVVGVDSGVLAPTEITFLRRQLLQGGFMEAPTSDAHFIAFERKL